MSKIFVEKLESKINGKVAYAIKQESIRNKNTYNVNSSNDISESFYVYTDENKAKAALVVVQKMKDMGLSNAQITLECARLNRISR